MPEAVKIIAPEAGEPLNVLGATVVMKSGGDPRRMAFGDHEVPVGYAVPLHVHEDEDELFYVLEGEVRFSTEAGETAVGPGAFVHAPHGAAHGFRNAADKPARMLVVAGPGGALDGFFRGMDTATGPLTGETIAQIAARNRIRLL